ncbi:MAG: hypothetical protein ACE5WD_14865 [Candidatus Aminicenantia bacterium]
MKTEKEIRERLEKIRKQKLRRIKGAEPKYYYRQKIIKELKWVLEIINCKKCKKEITIEESFPEDLCEDCYVLKGK